MQKCRPPNRERGRVADVVVVGSGIAGLFVATRCARAGLSTLVVTKKNLSDSSTNWAQGGIAAAMSNTDYEAHIKDTIEAGCGLSDPKIVEMVVREASDRIDDLIASGVEFDSNEDGFDLTIEGGHSSRRILHSKDATGAEIERALIVEARESPNLQLLESHMATLINNQVLVEWILSLVNSEVMAQKNGQNYLEHN